MTEDEFYKYFGYDVNPQDLKHYTHEDIQNAIDEMYPYLKVLGVDAQGIYDFIQNYQANPE